MSGTPRERILAEVAGESAVVWESRGFVEVQVNREMWDEIQVAYDQVAEMVANDPPGSARACADRGPRYPVRGSRQRLPHDDGACVDQGTGHPVVRHPAWPRRYPGDHRGCRGGCD